LQPSGIYNSSTSSWLTGSGSIDVSSGIAPPGTYYWDGPNVGGTGNGASEGGADTWSTSNANWDKGLVSREAWNNSNTDYKAIFGGTGGTVTLGEAITVKDIVFAGSTSYTISGQTLNFAPGGTITVSYQNAKHTITSAITGSPDVNIINGGTQDGLTFAPTTGTVTLGTCTVPYDDPVGGDKAGIHLAGTTTGNSVSKVQFQLAGDHYATLYKDGTGTWTVGDVDIGIVQINAGTLVANGTIRVYYGSVTLTGGTLCYNNAGTVYSAFVLNGGSLDNTSGAAITTSTYNPAQTWGGNWTFIGSNGANSDLNLGTGAVTLSATRQVTVQNAATTLTVGGVISGATFGLTKAGGGTLALSAANAYTGPTIVNAGTLLINGSLNAASAVTVNNNGTLGGTGTIKGTVTVNTGGTLGGTGTINGAITVEGGGTLSPGAGAGTLKANTSVTLADGAIYNWEFDSPTEADKVEIMGSLQLESGWKLSLGGAGKPAFGTTYDLFTYTDMFGGSFTGVIISTPAGWPPATFGQDESGDTKRIYLKFGKLGDTNSDGVVDAADFINLKKNFGKSGGAAQGDFNATGTVNWADLSILMNNMGTGGGAPATAPEPCSAILLMFGAAAVIRRRRKA